MTVPAPHPKLAKYRMLRHLPGRWGVRYRTKYGKAMAPQEFHEAVGRIAGTVCIDLGANMGEYTRLLAARAQSVIAFEPDPWAFARLEENVRDLGNVRLENAAVGTSTGTARLYRHRQFDEDRAFNSQSSSMLPLNRQLDTDGYAEVRQVDFLAFLAGLDGRVGILKIDIEGAEFDLLEALFDRPHLLARMDCIFAETHERFSPEFVPRVARLRERARRIDRPRVNLYWH